MTIVFWLTFGMLATAALLGAVRLVIGPSTLDRIVALELVVVLVAAGIAVGMAAMRDPANVTLLLVVALLGFIGSVTAVRLAEGMERHR